MPLQVGSPAPTFEAEAFLCASEEFKTISLSDYEGKWLCLYFYAMDFTGVCPTEVAAFDQAIDRFSDRECQVLGCSCDSVYVHKAWCEATEELANLKYPLLSDMTKRLAMDYGVLLAHRGVALRGTFIIDPEGILCWSSVYGLPVGRNVEEVLRVLDALQSGGSCPCNWTKEEPSSS